jgi:UDP-glucose 4-epimerase
MRKEPIEIWGDGSVIRDFIYIGDVAEAFAKAVNYKGIKSIFNISSGVGTSLNELIVNIESIIEYKVNCNYLPSRNFDVPVNILDNLLAKQELAWLPIVPLEDGLRRTIDWMKK